MQAQISEPLCVTALILVTQTWLSLVYFLSRLITPLSAHTPDVTLRFKCTVYKSILQIGPLSHIHVINLSLEAAASINYGLGRVAPWSDPRR